MAKPSLLRGSLQTALEIGVLFIDTLRAALRGRFRGREVVRQCYLIGNQSLLFVMFSLAFVGMVAVVQAGIQSQRLLGSYNFEQIGSAFLQILLRDSGPTIAALMLATRVGAGIAAEIGAMKVTEQVDALRMNEADPIEYLITPRVLACGMMMICLTVHCAVVAEIAGAFTASVRFGGNFFAFFSTDRIIPGDYILGLMKAIIYGISIPIVAGHAGLSAFGGSAGVGDATTRAVVVSSLVVIVENFFLTIFGFVVFFS